jgi:hypothetical protein
LRYLLVYAVDLTESWLLNAAMSQNWVNHCRETQRTVGIGGLALEAELLI